DEEFAIDAFDTRSFDFICPITKDPVRGSAIFEKRLRERRVAAGYDDEIAVEVTLCIDGARVVEISTENVVGAKLIKSKRAGKQFAVRCGDKRFVAFRLKEDLTIFDEFHAHAPARILFYAAEDAADATRQVFRRDGRLWLGR